MKRKNTGITLVALVITIILLLILAGITIFQLTGSGLFENARLAEQKSKEAQEKENEILTDYENQIAKYVDGNRNTSAYSIVKLGETIGKTEIAVDTSKYDALYIKTIESLYSNICTYYINTFELEEGNYVGNGGVGNSSRWSSISVTKTSVALSYIATWGTEYTSTSKIVVYGINY